MNRRKKSPQVQAIARERIQILLRLAQKEARAHPERAKRYVSLARKIGARYLLRLSPDLKATHCRECGAAWVPGWNVKVRLAPRRKCVEYTCECGGKRFFPLKKRKTKALNTYPNKI